jgi:alpha-tubulin suppressor-like RCC1 family protein
MASISLTHAFSHFRLLLLFLLASLLPGMAQNVITGVTVTTTSEWVGPTAGVREKMIDGSGLSASGPVLTQTHDNLVTAETMWHAGPRPGGIVGGVTGAETPTFVPPPVNTQDVEFDLEGNYDLTAAHIWNMNQAGDSLRGVKDVKILVSTSTTAAFTPLITTVFSQGTGFPGLTAQIVPLTGATNVRRVRFEIQSAWSGAAKEYVGLSEVRFQGTAVAALPPEIVIEAPEGSPLPSSLVAWGHNSEGQTTVPDAAKTGVTAIAGGGSHIVALKSDGRVVAWGRNNFYQTVVPPDLTGVIAIAAGVQHTVALMSNRSVIAWGANNYGEVIVPSDLTGVTAIAAGASHTVALKSNGSVVAWGRNTNGQTMVPVAAQTGVTAIAAGHSHTVALKSDGSVVAWGAGTTNSGNDPDYGQSMVPVGLSGVTAIAAGAGAYHTVALKSDGSVVAWGAGTTNTGVIRDHGQSVVPVAAQSGVTAIAAGSWHNVALKNGSVITWGLWTDSLLAVPAAAQKEVIAIAAGSDFTVVLKAPIVGFDSQNVATRSEAKTITVKNTGAGPLTLGSVSVTGGQASDFSVNTAGMLTSVPPGGSTTFTVTFTPAAAGARQTTLRVLNNDSDEGSFDIALTGTGVVLSANADLAALTTTAGTLSPLFTAGWPTYNTPPNVPNSTASVTVTPTVAQANATVKVNTVTVISGSASGPIPLAVGANTIAIEVTAESGVKKTYTLNVTRAAAIAIEHPPGSPLPASCVVAWQSNRYDQTTVPPAAQTGVTAIAAGGRHTVALKSDGRVVAWGYNFTGQTMVPLDLTDVTAIAAGYYHTVALKSDGKVVAWGWNSIVQVPPDLAGATAIAAGNSHTVALKSDGSVVAWGLNSYGQTDVPAAAQSGVTAIAAGYGHTVALKGDGSVVVWGDKYSSRMTVPPAALTGVTAIAAGGYHTVALKSDGSVVAWGANDDRQTDVPLGLTGVTAIAAGASHTVALKSDGRVVAWGRNNESQGNVPIDLTGVTAIAAGDEHTVALKAPSVAFGSQNVATSSEARTFTVKNSGAGPLTLSDVRVSGGQAADFAVNTAGMPISVPPGGSTTFSVTFTPAAAGARQTTLRVLNSDSDGGVYAIALSGAGLVVIAPPISWWAGENSAQDIAGANHGTAYNATYVAGRSGKAFSLTGAPNSYVSIPNNPNLKLSRGTAEAWIKTTDTSGFSGLMVKRWAWGMYLNAGKLHSHIFHVGDLTTSASVADGAWHHVAMTFEGSSLKLYVDGALKGSASNFAVTHQDENLVLGAGIGDGSLQNFNGLIDEAVVWDRALSAAEIAASYASAPPAGQSQPIGLKPGIAQVSSDGMFPNTVYRFECSPNMVNWILVKTVTTDASGSATATHANPPPGQALYRFNKAP